VPALDYKAQKISPEFMESFHVEKEQVNYSAILNAALLSIVIL
jgi:hypothetical protein